LKEATSLSGVPYTYEMLNSIGFSNMKLPSLRYITQAGGGLDAKNLIDYAKLSREKHFDFYVMYGATEATARMSYLSPEFNITKSGSIGKPIPSGSIRLESENKIITTPYKEGEIVYEGLNVMMGYANCREDLLKKDELHGVLRTGDIGYFDEAGFYYITGRKSRFLKVLGNRIGLHEVERHLACIGCRCFCGGEDDKLFISVQLDEVENFHDAAHKIKKEVITRFKIPVDLVHVLQLIDIPRSSCGKIKYKEIYKQYINQ
jgi:acyl-coenzyme A synthetase/AMP-(fatty) acid ligase